jgi:4-hydroxy-tetrahydrodipicolinate synthase
LTKGFGLRGVFTVLPTAFHDDGALDLAGVAALVRAARDEGVAGFTALGVMGEAAELTGRERIEVLTCIAETAGPLPIVVGVTGNDAAEVAGRASDAARAGAAAVMVSPTRSLGLETAVHAAGAANLPIVVQDYPPASGVTMTADEIASVAASHPLIVGVKAEAPPTSATIAALRRANPRLALVGGLGGLFLIDELRAGATGVMTGFALPKQLVAVVETYTTDPDGATAAWERLLPLMRLEAFAPYSLAARKEVWRLRGVIESAHCRRAGATLDDRARDDVRRALERVGASLSR